MRVFDAEFAARLAEDTTTLCLAWIVARADGVVFGFTDHDRDLVVDGVFCRADAAVRSSAVEAVSGLAADTTAVMGALTSATMTEADIAAGLWDAAEVRRLTVDWERPAFWVETFRGRFGEIRRGDQAFEVEVRGASDALSEVAGRVLMRQCDATLGEPRCGVDLSDPAYRGAGVVTAVGPGGDLTVSGLDGFATEWFAHGVLRWTSGANEGRAGAVLADDGSTIRQLRLRETPLAAVAVGDAFEVTAGCDKRAETCRVKFSNISNFQGFPHIPGEDFGMSYPRSGGRHDGGSLFGGS